MSRRCEMSQWELTAAQSSHSFCGCPIRLSSVGCHGEYLKLLELQGAAVFYSSGGQMAGPSPMAVVSGPCLALYLGDLHLVR